MTSDPTPPQHAPPLVDVRSQRLRKAATLREIGINPYPARSRRTHYAGPIVNDFEAHDGKPAVVAGRLMSHRKMGALAFGHIQDQTGRIQLYMRRDSMPPTDAGAGTLGFADLNLLDVG